MVTTLVILLGLWTLAFVGGVVAYFRYTRSPIFLWRQQVFAYFVRVVTEANDAQYTLDVLDAGNDAIGAVKHQFALATFANVSVESLTRFPGIGPITITRLRDASINTVAQLASTPLGSIPNLAKPQETALREALDKMYRDALSRLSAQASPEAVAAAQELERLTAGQRQQRQEATQKKARADAGLVAITTRLKVAEQIRFQHYLTGTAPIGWSRELQLEPLPLLVAVPVTSAPPTPPTPPTPANPVPHPPAPVNPVEPVSKPGELPSLTRFRVVARFGYAVAKADGRTHAGEKRQIRVFLERRYATAPYLASKLHTLIADIEKDVPTLDDSLREVHATIPPDGWPELNQFAISVTDASGERNARKNDVLARVAKALTVTPPTPPTPPTPVVAAPTPTLVTPAPVVPVAPPAPKPPTDAECKKTLEIAFDTSLNVELIRRQYRLLMERYDPAKFTAHGADFVQLATAKRTALEKAAKQLLKPYNEPLEPPTVSPPTDIRHNPDLDDFFGG